MLLTADVLADLGSNAVNMVTPEKLAINVDFQLVVLFNLLQKQSNTEDSFWLCIAAL